MKDKMKINHTKALEEWMLNIKKGKEFIHFLQSNNLSEDDVTVNTEGEVEDSNGNIFKDIKVISYEDFLFHFWN
ncbi:MULTISPECIES: hypothetical protein [Bacillus]|uniref:hypothetical protein n=1 Tax=Bacillus TaxID=1386 RepID=UPI0021E1900C|nr:MULTISPECIES: hypothetical protein [Bacillus]MCV0023401.1 hypothetical protein [Bacillus sp. XT-2]MCV0025688.1 hypothetical protein [Bacillus sp. XT-2]WHY22665.1 hypothetical protein QNH41_11410 [Bacillus halotolerans]